MLDLLNFSTSSLLSLSLCDVFSLAGCALMKKDTEEL